MENNKPAGFDIELLDGLAKTMGREAVNIDTRFPNLIPGLQGGRFDITNSSMYITAERLKVIDMVPYLKSGEAILARKGGDYQPKTPEAFCGHKIGSMGATSWLAQLQKLSTDYCVKKGLKPIALSVYTTDPQTTRRCCRARWMRRSPTPPWRAGWWKNWVTGWLSPLTR